MKFGDRSKNLANEDKYETDQFRQNFSFNLIEMTLIIGMFAFQTATLPLNEPV